MRKLGRKKSNREHVIKNLAASLVLYETVDATEGLAKEAKSYLEKVISRNKENGLSEKRAILQSFFSKDAAHKVIDELLPRYKDKKSGFIKSYHLKNRSGDNARMIRLELVDKKVFVDKEASKKIEKETEAKPSSEKTKKVAAK